MNGIGKDSITVDTMFDDVMAKKPVHANTL